MLGSRYDTDLLLWSEEQARALRAAARQGSNAPIDWDHVAEELESLGAAELRALASHIGTVIEHLLKLQASPAIAPAGAGVTASGGHAALSGCLTPARACGAKSGE